MAPRDPRDPRDGRDLRVPRDEFETETPTAVRQFRFLEARVQRLEMRDSFFFGFEQDKGAWQTHREEYEVVKEDVDVLKGFRGKALLLITIGGSLLGLVAGVAAVLVEKVLK